MRLDDLAHRASKELRAAGRHSKPSVKAPGSSAKPGAGWIVALGSLAAALAIGVPFMLLSQDDGASTNVGDSSTTTPGTLTVRLDLSAVDGVLTLAGQGYPVGELIEAWAEWLMYEAASGPAPAFDTSLWGEEIALTVAEPVIYDDDTVNLPSIYLGDVDSDSAFLTAKTIPADDESEGFTGPCVWIGEEGMCSHPGLPWALVRNPGEVVAIWVGVPDGTAAVALVSSGGPVGWQTPRSRTVIIPTTAYPIEMVALDGSGNILAYGPIPGEERTEVPVGSIPLPETTLAMPFHNPRAIIEGTSPPWEPDTLTSAYYEVRNEIVLIVTGPGLADVDELCGTVFVYHSDNGTGTSWSTPQATCAKDSFVPVSEATVCPDYIAVHTNWGVLGTYGPAQEQTDQIPTRLTATLYDDLGDNPSVSLGTSPGAQPAGAGAAAFVHLGAEVWQCGMYVP